MTASSIVSLRQYAAHARTTASRPRHSPTASAGSSQGDENAGVDRVADPAIGTVDDELMVALERDVRAPVARDPHPRPDGEGDAREGKRRAEPHGPQDQGHKAVVQD